MMLKPIFLDKILAFVDARLYICAYYLHIINLYYGTF